MPPPNPKRPQRPGPPSEPRPARPKPTTEVDLPFDTAEVTPLRVDDPAPQRVAQYPASGSRRRNVADQVPTEVIQIPGELSQSFKPATETTWRPVFLYVEKGPGAGQLVPVPQGKLILGRSSSSDLRLQHPSISRRHAELTRTGERFFLKDLGSQNGTYVNKARLIAEREVFTGDTLALGTAILKLRGPMSGGEVTGSHRRGRGLKLALFACAALFGLASILLYAVLRTPSHAVAQPEPLNAPVPHRPEGPTGPLVPAPDLRHAEGHAAPASGTASTHPQTERKTAPVAKKPAATQRRVTERHPTRHPVHHPAKAVSAHRAPARRVALAEPAVRTDTGVNAGALDAYRQGELSDALRLASGSLAETLQRFQAEYNAGRRALADHDPATASSHFRAALALDRGIAHGEGTFNGILRHELDELKTLESYESPAKAPSSTRQRIDSAFGSPAPKKHAGSQPAARQAIDAAFGD